MRNGGEHSLNAAGRRAQRARLLALYGDGNTCPCVHCGAALTASTMHRDRVQPGGRYAIRNLVPSCAFCNESRGKRPMSADAKRQWRNAVRRYDRAKRSRPSRMAGKSRKRAAIASMAA